MASTLQMTGRLSPADEASAAGVRRSRFSLHLNTPHTRRWLLVQLVSTPAGKAGEESGLAPASLAQTSAQTHRSLGRLLDDYLDTRARQNSW